jgi:hypothetical protein
MTTEIDFSPIEEPIKEAPMTATQTAGSPALHFGPFNTARSLGIDRGNYIAIHSSNPQAAAQ